MWKNADRKLCACNKSPRLGFQIYAETEYEIIAYGSKSITLWWRGNAI